MRVAVFGAAGRTGRLVVEEALRRDHDVTAAVRDPSKVSFEARVRVAEGDARRVETVAAALEGADAVISVLAIPPGTASLTDLSDATRAIVSGMEAAGPGRLVVAVNATVFHDRPVQPPYDVVTAEHRRDQAILRASALEWTALAPSRLTDDPATGDYATEVDGRAPAGGSSGGGIPRGDLASAALDALHHDDWIGHTVGVSA